MNMTEEIEKIENLLSRLDAVKKGFEEVENSTDELLDREAEVVNELVDRFGPLAAYVGDRAKVSYRHPGGQFADGRTELDDEATIPLGRVVQVDDTTSYERVGEGEPCRSKTGADDTRGVYEGTVFRLGADGLLKYSYDGSWSNWQGEGSRFECSKSEASPAEVLEHFDLEDVLNALTTAIEEAVEENEDKREFISKRKKTIEALEKVLAL